MMGVVIVFLHVLYNDGVCSIFKTSRGYPALNQVPRCLAGKAGVS